MLHIVCALLAEARPVIETYRLSYCDDAGLFSRYQDLQARLSLTITGVGKLAAAQAVLATEFYFPGRSFPGQPLCGQSPAAWLNIGVCGHAAHPVGLALLVNKITEQSSGRNWYPQCCFTTALPQDCLITVDQPETDYGQGLYDMEGAGFYDAASRISTAELIHAVKIVSDNKHCPVTAPNGRTLSGLVEQNLPQIESIMQALLDLQATQAVRHSATQEVISQLTACTHYTACQKNTLRQLIAAWTALYPHPDSLLAYAQKNADAKEVLRFIRTGIENAELPLPTSADV